jgi:hypothetical protein
MDLSTKGVKSLLKKYKKRFRLGQNIIRINNQKINRDENLHIRRSTGQTYRSNWDT